MDYLSDIDDVTCAMEKNRLDVELKELSRLSFSPQIDKQPYLKGLQWSPDGNRILIAVNGQGLKIVDIPEDLRDVSSPSGN